MEWQQKNGQKLVQKKLNLRWKNTKIYGLSKKAKKAKKVNKI